MLVHRIAADGNDWVSPLYVLSVSNGQIDGSSSSDAQARIQQAGVWSAAKAPWTVLNQNVTPPSGDRHDYLSWAPYWWPNCNWCGQNSAQSGGDNGDDPDYPSSSSSSSQPLLGSVTSLTSAISSANPTAHPYQPLDPLASVAQLSDLPLQPYQLPQPQLNAQIANQAPLANSADSDEALDGSLMRRRLRGANALWPDQTLPNLSEDRSFQQQYASQPVRRRQEQIMAAVPSAHPVPMVHRLGHAKNWLSQYKGHQMLVEQNHHVLASRDEAATTTTKTNKINMGATTTSAQLQGKAYNGGGGSCTPSRTSVAPSATYSVCPYVQKDGKVNPDSKTLNNTRDIVSMAQSVLWNGVAYGLSNDTSYAERATSIIYTWFINPQTAINPNVKYGQVIRGPPGNQEGGYTGILDWRMLLKVVNSVVIMRAKGAPSWNKVMASGMSNWASNYIKWLSTSKSGKDLIKSANNHVTFFYNQLIALYILVGDIQSAQQAANAYFTGPFMEQIDASGEQPLEAKRTRPFHYRCFNVEAMIANAKLADNLALNMWSAQSSGGATIQTAVDYMMTLDASDEDITELAPHVAAVAAAYGDPDGKYATWLSSSDNTGDEGLQQSWRFYDNPSAFYCSPASGDTTSSQSFPAS